MRVDSRGRVDLPVMGWPLLMVAVLISVGAAWMGAVVAGSPVAGIVAALPFWAVSAAVYSSVMVLCRKVASLLVTPVTALCLWMSGCSMFCVAAVSLSLLFVSCLTANCLLTGKSRFVRMASLSCGIAFALTLCGFTGLAMQYASFSAFYEETLTTLHTLLQQTSVAENLSIAATTASELLYTMFLSLPAMLGVTAEILASSVFFLCSTFLRILDCADYFRPAADNRISTPPSFGGIALVILFMTLFTSPYDNPLLYAVLSNILSVISLPCAYVGIRELLGRLRNKYAFYSITVHEERRSRFPLSAILVIVILTTLFGLSNTIFLFTAMGAVYILRTRKSENNTADTLSES